VGFDNDGVAGRLGSRFVVIIEKNGLEHLAHVPFEVVGKHTEKNVSTYPVTEAMMDGSDLDVDCLKAAKRPFGVRELFIGFDGRRRV